LEFGADGRCTRNPHSDKAIPKAAAVATYAVREKAGLVWFWGGDAAQADESLIPDFSAVTSAPPEATIKGYMPAACGYELLVDNILDLTHVDFLHPTTLGSGALSGVQPQVSERGERSVHIVWQSSGQPAPAAFDMGLRLQGQPTAQWTEVTWTAPSCMLLNVGATLLGETREQGASTLNLHLATPETATTMHYWYWTTRSFAIGAEANAQIRPLLEHVFTQEDKPMIEAQQRRIGSADYDTLKPVLLAGDAGSVRVRRRLRQLMDAEHSA
jgi:vanillate O-demethylase monooxygenase subunit